MRQIVAEKMNQQNLKCQCIRCREVQDKGRINKNLELRIENYEANNGTEIFISFEDSFKPLGNSMPQTVPLLLYSFHAEPAR